MKYVALTAPDTHGLAAVGYGGAQNDHTSIVLGLQYETQCDSAGSASD